MQKAPKMKKHILLPIPAELAEAIGLDPFSTIQFMISRGRLIIEPIEAEYNMVCFGDCRNCPRRYECEGPCL